MLLRILEKIKAINTYLLTYKNKKRKLQEQKEEELKKKTEEKSKQD